MLCRGRDARVERSACIFHRERGARRRARVFHREHERGERISLEVRVLSIAAGLAGGVIHAMSGPDHVAAVAPLTLDGRRSGLVLGLIWGLGHGAGVAVIGAVLWLAKGAVPIDTASAWAEFLVGFLLIGMGAWAGYRGLKLHRQADRPMPHTPKRRPVTFGVGALHGSAGASHLLAVLPTAGFSATGAAGYLIAYMVGAAGAMGAIGWIAGSISTRLGARFQPWLLLGAGAIACLVGVVWLVRSWPG
ncbi:MAG: hypothetical protein KF915_16340 [Polyangiaceae bacterium]|nr:hypothetical protein [Polyangiaceae bacterium]